MTRLKDLIERAKGLESDEVCLPDSDIVKALGFDPYDADYSRKQERLRKVWVTRWVCTDRVVGVCLYFLDGEFVARGNLPYRKSDEKFDWASEDAFLKTRKYVEEYIQYPWPAFEILWESDYEGKMDDQFHIQFWCGAMACHKATYQGRPFKVLEVPNPIVPTDIVIEKDGVPMKVTVEDIDIEYFPGAKPKGED